MLLRSIAIASVVVGTWTGTGCDRNERTTEGASPVVRIVATDYGYEAPDTVPAGLNVFRIVNRGNHGHAATIVHLESGKTLPEYLQAYEEANRTRSARPAWATFHGGPGALLPGDSATTTNNLEPGNYAWVCFVPDANGVVHLRQHKQAHAFIVQQSGEPASAATAPVPGVSLQTLDYSFQLSEPLKAGRQLIRVENTGVEPHHVLMFKLAPGRTLEEYLAWMNDQRGEPPAALVGMMGELSTGKEGFFEVNLTPGDYVIVCLVAGRDEVPHSAKGMIQRIRIS